MKTKKVQKAPFLKSIVNPLGFRTSDHFRGKNFGGKTNSSFNPTLFKKTQHKG